MIHVLSGLILLFAAETAHAASQDDWKAPLPTVEERPKPKPARPRVRPESLPEQARDLSRNLPGINTVIIPDDHLPYITAEGYDLRFGINPKVLEIYGVQSGDNLPWPKVMEIIDADRNFRKNLLH